MSFYVSKKGPNNQYALNEAGRHLHDTFLKVYGEDNLIVLDRNLAFLDDAQFNQLVSEAAISVEERGLAWRAHVAGWFGKQALALGGDFVECGVLRGFTSYFLCKYLNFQDYPGQFWLYDTFAGLPDQYSSETERNMWNVYYQQEALADLYSLVKQRFAAFANVHVVQGMVPDSLISTPPGNIAFLHLDMNAEAAERLALENLFPKLMPGAVILLDDYGWTAHQPQMESARAFFGGKQLPILELPTGQGVVVMPRA